MSNPFFSRSTAFKEGGHAPGTAPAQTPNGYPTMPGYQAGQYGQQRDGEGCGGPKHGSAPVAEEWVRARHRPTASNRPMPTKLPST